MAPARALAAHWKPIALLGLLGGGCTTCSSTGASLTPALIIVMGAALLGDPFPRRAGIGASIAFAGVLVLIRQLDACPFSPALLLAYHFWNLGVAAVGSARAGVFLYLTPFFGAVLAVALLGERFGAHHGIGMALIIGGVAIATRKAL